MGHCSSFRLKTLDELLRGRTLEKGLDGRPIVPSATIADVKHKRRIGPNSQKNLRTFDFPELFAPTIAVTGRVKSISRGTLSPNDLNPVTLIDHITIAYCSIELCKISRCVEIQLFDLILKELTKFIELEVCHIAKHARLGPDFAGVTGRV